MGPFRDKLANRNKSKCLSAQSDERTYVKTENTKVEDEEN
jgi:hypothetical protein